MTEIGRASAETVPTQNGEFHKQVKDWFLINGGRRSEEFDLFLQLCAEIVEVRTAVEDDPASRRKRAAKEAAEWAICFLQIAHRYDLDILAAMRVKDALKRTDGCLREVRQ